MSGKIRGKKAEEFKQAAIAVGKRMLDKQKRKRKR